MLHLPIGFDLALQSDKFFGALIDSPRTWSPTAPTVMRSIAIARNAVSNLTCTRAGTRATRSTSHPVIGIMALAGGSRDRGATRPGRNALPHTEPAGFHANPRRT